LPEQPSRENTPQRARNFVCSGFGLAGAMMNTHLRPATASDTSDNHREVYKNNPANIVARFNAGISVSSSIWQ
jgi:hypothetical protein